MPPYFGEFLVQSEKGSGWTEVLARHEEGKADDEITGDGQAHDCNGHGNVHEKGNSIDPIQVLRPRSKILTVVCLNLFNLRAACRQSCCKSARGGQKAGGNQTTEKSNERNKNQCLTKLFALDKFLERANKNFGCGDRDRNDA